jgi:uncharacterized repeat protein (TIGR01451 family)
MALAVAAALPSRSRSQAPEFPPYPAPAPAPVEALPAPDVPENPPTPRDNAPAARPARTDTATRPQANAPRDPAIRRTADPADDADPLGPAKLKPGAAPVKSEKPNDGYGLTDRVPAGPQAVGLSVEVVAPEVMNVGQIKTVKLIIRNTGAADAGAVHVHYSLPKELELVSAQPEAKSTPDEPAKLSWGPYLIAAGSDQIVALKVKPKLIGTIDHSSSVTLTLGARSHSTIQEPMLRVEQVVTPAKVLKGQPAEFRITVSNPGSGPARNVTVQAKLSSGLKANGDEIVEQTIAVIQPGQRVELDPLVADTIAGGEQNCTVTAYSDDVAQSDAKVVRNVTVLRPDLALKIDGPTTRYTDTPADYGVTVLNPGTAAAKNVRVSVLLPASGGVLVKPLPPGAEWNKATQKLSWVVPNLEPARGDVPGKSSSTFHVRLNGMGLYRVVAEARAADLAAKDSLSTSVSGMADVDLDVVERKRVLDVGETTVFDITLKNVGTKEAKNLLISADLKNVKADFVAGTDTDAHFDLKTDRLIFPPIASLAAGRELNLGIRVKATKPGTATCRVYVMHDDVKDADGALEDVASARVTSDSRVK